MGSKLFGDDGHYRIGANEDESDWTRWWKDLNFGLTQPAGILGANLISFAMDYFANAEAKKQNEARYNEGYDLLGGIMREGTSAAESASRTGIRSARTNQRLGEGEWNDFVSKITGGYTDRYDRGMDLLKGGGQQEGRDIDKRFSGREAEIMMDLAERGLGGTSARSSFKQGIERDRVAEQARLGERLRRDKQAADASLSGDMLRAVAAAESGRMSFNQRGRDDVRTETERLTMLPSQVESMLAGPYTSWIGSREDVYPNWQQTFSNVQNAMQASAAAQASRDAADAAGETDWVSMGIMGAGALFSPVTGGLSLLAAAPAAAAYNANQSSGAGPDWGGGAGTPFGGWGNGGATTTGTPNWNNGGYNAGGFGGGATGGYGNAAYNAGSGTWGNQYLFN